MSVPVGIPGVGPVTDDAGRTLPAVRAFNPFDTAGRDPSGPHRADDASPGRRSRALTERRAVRALAGLVLPAVLLALWQWATTTGRVPAYQLPTPESVWLAAIDLAERGLLGQYVAISTQRVLIGFAVGALLGLAVGALVGLSRVSDVLLAPALGAVRAVPSLAWVPLLLLWVGINEDSKLILIAIGAFFPVYTTVAGALRHVDPHLVEAGRAYGLTGARLLARVQLPAVVPTVISGLRLALAQSWLFLVAAELLNSSMGLGFLLLDSGQNGRIDRMILAIVLLALLGKLTDSLIGVAEKSLLRRWA
ncbi:ABC transporter permease [Cellulomonas chengniuliangii]|uniref:ABC transporter permease n=1 Tax=Cellulomonas chengniuliangii TaxID=2968084 RepID=A0ABY5KV11_9CELL|nr:ABC transporter permease [Cellulomonas chengniuliangii]MCC2308980.1 ABC transporter permease [Cellulomonas chengniuliangii]MCC2319381.1 ABC transporter permease [Cellulomonas chengniuliangii]UUI74285.1 ABC transporter permease [Cellulomonas chengniuliangii]